MPIKETIVRTRPSVLVPWYTHPEVKANYRYETYVLTGKLTQTITPSDDGLVDVIETTFRDQEALDEMKNDPNITFNIPERLAYSEANGITWTLSTSTW